MFTTRTEPSRIQNITQDDVVRSFVEKSYENGIDVFRIFDALNDIRNMELSIKVAKEQGATCSRNHQLHNKPIPHH